MPCLDDGLQAGVLPIDGNTQVWRYLDLPRLTALLATRSLWLARLDSLEDPFEGSLTLAAARRREADQSRLVEEARHKALAAREQHIAKLGLDEESGARFREATVISGPSLVETRAGNARYGRLMRLHVCVNCWHASSRESVAMWRLYGRANESIAIRSTVSRLRHSLRSAPLPLFIGGVRYLDYVAENFPADDPSPNFPLAWFTSKDVSYEHEREVRLVYWHRPGLPGGPEGREDGSWFDEKSAIVELGVSVPVDLAQLMEAVYVSPFAPRWFRDTVKQVLLAFGSRVPVSQSRLASEPVY